MLAVAVPKRNKLQNIIVLTPKDGHRSFYRKGDHGGNGPEIRCAELRKRSRILVHS